MEQNSGFKLTVQDGRNEEHLTQVMREAVRGVIETDGKYLLIRSDLYGEYKFPGGGIEAGESREETLMREVMEETGCFVEPDTLQYLGVVEEHRKGLENDFFHMTSYYYKCSVSLKQSVQSLMDYEVEYGYKPVLIQLNDAIRVNESIADTDPVPWVDRDTAVMRHLMNEKNRQQVE